MGFIPKDATAPAEKSNYLKLIEGTIKFRIVSDLVYGYEYWRINAKTNKPEPVRLHEEPKEKPADVKLEEDGSYKINHFWAFKVIDRADKTVKVLEITQNGVKRQMEDLIENPDWANPEEYDYTITGKGKGKERRYSVQTNRPEELTAKEKSIVARTEIDLEKLFDGIDPFDKSEKPADVPF